MVRGPTCWLRDGTQLVALTGDRAKRSSAAFGPRSSSSRPARVVPRRAATGAWPHRRRGDLAAVAGGTRRKAGSSSSRSTTGGATASSTAATRPGTRTCSAGLPSSPDGRFVAVTEGRQRWWEGGRERGRLTVVDVGTGAPHHYPISDDPPESAPTTSKASATASSSRPRHLCRIRGSASAQLRARAADRDLSVSEETPSPSALA